MCCAVEISGVGKTKKVMGYLKGGQSEFAKECRFQNVEGKPSEFVGFPVELPNQSKSAGVFEVFPPGEVSMVFCAADHGKASNLSTAS